MTDVGISWIDYWNTTNLFRDFNWLKNMQIFIRATEPIMNYSAEDTVLDIGCGPGYLAAFLMNRVKEIYCTDTSARYLDLCRERFRQHPNVLFHELDESNYTDFSFFEGPRFSIIICLSVVQYYGSITDVEKLIREVRRIALARSQVPDCRHSGQYFVVRRYLGPDQDGD
ncbi:MAG: class I SAM-dependent methyltransferase [Chloroflexi bacterium]|nr:class I SAM-dependent methyltransferase [Chloroflexota bacterium]